MGNEGSQTFVAPNRGSVIKAKVRLGVTRLFKNYLFEFESLVSAHDEAIAKLKSALPEQYRMHVELADYLSDTKIEIMRKKVLGAGNDLIRDVDDTVDALRIE